MSRCKCLNIYDHLDTSIKYISLNCFCLLEHTQITKDFLIQNNYSYILMQCGLGCTKHLQHSHQLQGLMPAQSKWESCHTVGHRSSISPSCWIFHSCRYPSVAVAWEWKIAIVEYIRKFGKYTGMKRDERLVKYFLKDNYL